MAGGFRLFVRSIIKCDKSNERNQVSYPHVSMAAAPYTLPPNEQPPYLPPSYSQLAERSEPPSYVQDVSGTQLPNMSPPYPVGMDGAQLHASVPPPAYPSTGSGYPPQPPQPPQPIGGGYPPKL